MAGLLCELRHPLQGREEQEPRGEEGPHTSTKVRILRAKTQPWSSWSQARHPWGWSKDFIKVSLVMLSVILSGDLLVTSIGGNSANNISEQATFLKMSPKRGRGGARVEAWCPRPKCA